MAGSMNDIKARIKSVGSTMQITKAMELVATSKLRRQKERAEASRAYREELLSVISRLATPELSGSVWCRESEGRTLYVMIAGDRGLAGGYNANVFRTVRSLDGEGLGLYLPIGKKALEHTRHRRLDTLSEDFGSAAGLSVGDAMHAAGLIAGAFRDGKVGRVVLVYTYFASMLAGVVKTEGLLPLSLKAETSDPIFEGEPEELCDRIVPDYLGGVIYTATLESIASESGARRTAMNSASKNAEAMTAELMLLYNRARQAAITQEITEIVSGADAL